MAEQQAAGCRGPRDGDVRFMRIALQTENKELKTPPCPWSSVGVMSSAFLQELSPQHCLTSHKSTGILLLFVSFLANLVCPQTYVLYLLWLQNNKVGFARVFTTHSEGRSQLRLLIDYMVVRSSLPLSGMWCDTTLETNKYVKLLGAGVCR